MKFSEQWLREWVNPRLNTAELVEQLTMAGLEVDAVEPVAGPFSGVVVAEITTVKPHPDADSLRVCEVNTGTKSVQVVCGAPNARAGLKAPLATVGAVLPGDFKIKKAKLRGVESFGMLCAEQELGLSDASSGLMELPADAEAGQDLRAYLGLDDSVIEVDLTPNRADCLGVRGIARDVATLNGMAFNEVACEEVPAELQDRLPVLIEAETDCPRYVGRVLRNIDITAKSPLWLREKLRRSGIRSIDAVVDVTNYVLLELGQPMHAFDLKQIQGGIVVRKAKPGEQLVLLDERELVLNPEHLVIADQQRPLALAGIMGGRDSGVTDSTRDLFLEAAFFAPAPIAGRARSLGLHTDSSHRFERGVDYQLAVQAMERATRLLLDIVGGEPGPLIDVSTPALPQPRQVVLRAARIARVLGVTLPDTEVEKILQSLGLVLQKTGEGWSAQIPSWRFDLTREVDLLEELARIHGYNKLPVSTVREPLTIRDRPEQRLDMRSLRRQLLARGYQEAITYSFVEPALQQAMLPDLAGVPVKNPISSDMAVMRTSLWPGLIRAMNHNLKRQQPRVRLFETGLRFVAGEQGLLQQACVAGAITGRRFPESWTEQGELVDFFDIKGDVESLLSLRGNSGVVEFRPAVHSALHPGQCAELLLDGQSVGHLGALHPRLRKACDIVQPVYLFEILLAEFLNRQPPQFQQLSRYPEVRRDLALLVGREIPASAIMEAARGAGGDYVTNLKLFDIYAGEGIDPQRKSMAIGLTFQHTSRTLTEEEVSRSIDQIVKILENRFGATLRN